MMLQLLSCHATFWAEFEYEDAVTCSCLTCCEGGSEEHLQNQAAGKSTQTQNFSRKRCRIQIYRLMLLNGIQLPS